MKLSKRLLTILMLVLLVLSLLFAFGYVNSMVSYKYEVQDDQYAGKTLNEHQKQILYYIISSKVEAIVSAILFIITLTLRATLPNLNGKIKYVK